MSTRALALAAALWLASHVSAQEMSAQEMPAQELSAQEMSEVESALAGGVEAYGVALSTPERDERLARFRRAEGLFARASTLGARSAALYVNWGNAALQGERLGAAVLAYRRALAIDPDHSQARQNLEHARSLLPEWVPRPESPALLDGFFAWHATMSPEERARVAAICFAVAATLLAVAIRWRIQGLRNLALVPGLAWLALVGSLALEVGAAIPDSGVVTAPETAARAADSIHAPTLSARPLPSGTEVKIVETREGWLRVGLANGREVWVTEASVTPVIGG